MATYVDGLYFLVDSVPEDGDVMMHAQLYVKAEHNWYAFDGGFKVDPPIGNLKLVHAGKS